jgi:hypothetical protein
MTSVNSLAVFRPVTARDHAIARASRDDFWEWLAHVTRREDRRQRRHRRRALHRRHARRGDLQAVRQPP